MGKVDDRREKISAYLVLDKSLRALIVTSAITNLSNNLWTPLLGLYITGNLGISALLFGLINTVQGLVTSLTELPSGFLSDIFGRKKMMILSCVFSILTLATLLIVVDLPLLFLVSIFQGLSTGFIDPSLSAYVTDAVSYERRGAAYATLAVFQSFSTVVATSAGGTIAGNFGFVWIFRLGIIFQSFTLIGLTFYLRESLNRNVLQSRPTMRNSIRQFRNGLAILKSPPLLAVLLGIVFHQLGLGIESPFLTIYAGDVLLFALPTISLMLGMQQLGIFIGHFPSGRIVDKFSGEITFAFHIAVTSPVLILYTFSRNPLFVSMVLFAWGLTFGLDNVSRQKLISKYREESGVATAFGAINLVAGLVSLASPAVGGWIWTSSSPQMVFYVSALVNVLGSLPLFFLWAHNRSSNQDRRH